MSIARMLSGGGSLAITSRTIRATSRSSCPKSSSIDFSAEYVILSCGGVSSRRYAVSSGPIKPGSLAMCRMILAAYPDDRGGQGVREATLALVLHELQSTVDGRCPRCGAVGDGDPFCPECEERECRRLRQRLFGIVTVPDRRTD